MFKPKSRAIHMAHLSDARVFQSISIHSDRRAHQAIPESKKDTPDGCHRNYRDYQLYNDQNRTDNCSHYIDSLCGFELFLFFLGSGRVLCGDRHYKRPDTKRCTQKNAYNRPNEHSDIYTTARRIERFISRIFSVIICPLRTASVTE